MESAIASKSVVCIPGRSIYRILLGGWLAFMSPWENGHIESFHDKLRDECLNRELFGNLHEARIILESWRVEYNERRPHSSLGIDPERVCREKDGPV